MKGNVLYLAHVLLGLKKKKIVSFIKMQMDFEDIILSEITQKEKDKYCMISHVESKKKTKQTKKHSWKER